MQEKQVLNAITGWPQETVTLRLCTKLHILLKGYARENHMTIGRAYNLALGEFLLSRGVDIDPAAIAGIEMRRGRPAAPAQKIVHCEQWHHWDANKHGERCPICKGSITE